MAKWIEKSTMITCQPDKIECSNCHCSFRLRYMRKTQYCPECGAKMDNPDKLRKTLQSGLERQAEWLRELNE